MSLENKNKCNLENAISPQSNSDDPCWELWCRNYTDCVWSLISPLPPSIRIRAIFSSDFRLQLTRLIACLEDEYHIRLFMNTWAILGFIRGATWEGKENVERWNEAWTLLTWPQPYLAGVGKVASFFLFEDLFLFFKAFAAAAATGIEHLCTLLLVKDNNTDTDNAA